MSRIDDRSRKDEEYYALSREIDKTYFSKQFNTRYSPIKMRYGHKLLSNDGNEFVLKDERTIGISWNGNRQLKALFMEHNRFIKKLVIQQFGIESGLPLKNRLKEASFTFDEMQKLYLFLKAIYEVRFNDENKLNVSDNELKELLINGDQAKNVVRDNAKLIEEAINSELTAKEIIHYGYRKKQLQIFETILADENEFNTYKNELEVNGMKIRGEEAVWQYFFEKNSWILGYGLQYIFNTSLDDKKLEQITSGAGFNSKGKRIDALLKSVGAVNSLCFCEIKLSSDKLLKKVVNPYRGESWQISDALAGAIAQVQRTVQKAVQDIKSKIEIKDTEDNLTGEEIYIYNPKSYILIGNLSEFVVDGRINEVKFSSFEMFRKSINGIEIMTYDELYQRAKFICENEK